MILTAEPRIEIVNTDCIQLMKLFGENQFDLAIVDPPYGLGRRLIYGGKKGGMGSLRTLADDKLERWDIVPDKEYFEQLMRVSKKQIIWGGNYFLDHLGATDGFLVWDKMNGTNPMSDAELAWKSFEGTTRMFRMHHFSAGYEDKIHPTQKPTKLYEWILKNYAEEGYKILDTHCGSGSLALACYKNKYQFMGIEIDTDYFEKSVKRYKEVTSQTSLF